MATDRDRTSPVDRIALSLPEARIDHNLSQRQFARLSGVSRASIAKIERGGRVDPAILVRLGAALVVLDVYQPPEPEPADAIVFDLERELDAWPRAAGDVDRNGDLFGGAA